MIAPAAKKLQQQHQCMSETGGQTVNCVASVCLYSFKLITAQKQGGNETLLNPNSHH